MSQVMQYPKQAERVCGELAELFRGQRIDSVVGPAMGGVLIAYEVARALGVRAIFAEKGNGAMVLRRGFRVEPGEKFLAVEDAVTTGGSVFEAAKAVRAAGGEVAAVGALVDRSGGKVDFGVPFRTLLQLEMPSYDPAECPLCREGVLLTEPKKASSSEGSSRG